PAVCSRRSCRARLHALDAVECPTTAAVSPRTEQRAAHPYRFCRGLRSGPARSDQARPSDFIALLGEGPQVEIAEPDRPVAVIALGQRDRLFPHGLGQVDLAVPPLDVAIAADPVDLVVGRVLPHRDLFRIATRRCGIELSRTVLPEASCGRMVLKSSRQTSKSACCSAIVAAGGRATS